jgi:BNR repeat-containing family member
MSFLFRLSIASLALLSITTSAQRLDTKLVPIAKGWSKNQINAVIFRHNSLISHGAAQFGAFYDENGKLVLVKRKLGTAVQSRAWLIRPSQYAGDVKDAHKSISIAVDGAGYLHVAWNHHNSRLQYCRSTRPGSLELSDQMPMTGDLENRVTYPEFYQLPGGDLIFLYRDGSSGNGTLVINRYDVKTGKWYRVQRNMIDGESTRNAYWQAFVDQRGTIHLSWVWRETPDVISNHDVCYAKSIDKGKTWQKTTGEKYRLPITAASAEYVQHIPEKSDLINQTSMSADQLGRPYIVTYWRANGENVPQYRLIYHDGRSWKTSQITHRTLAFTLAGTGTRRIPLSRPQVVNYGSQVIVIFRDEERGSRVSAAVSRNLSSNSWDLRDLTETPVGMWEPTYDPNAWAAKHELHLFVQNVGQGDAESLEELPPQMISVLEWKPKRAKSR